MAKKRYTPRKKHDEGKHLAVQRLLMRKHFPCFDCSLKGGVLECLGEITPCKECETYKVRITLARGGVPQVRVVEPEIPLNPKIHVFSTGHLCLYDHREKPWKDTDKLHAEIVPWTAEWLVYYELFLLTEEWLGPEAPHEDAPKPPESN